MNIVIQPVPKTTIISSVIPLINGANVLDYCQRMSGEVWSGYIDDKLICCWGLVPPTVFSNIAYLWMYFNSDAVTHADIFVFIRRSQIEIEKMLQRYPIIRGDCLFDNWKAIRWLRWLGADFGEPRNGLRPFVIRRKANG